MIACGEIQKSQEEFKAGKNSRNQDFFNGGGINCLYNSR